MGQDSKKTDLPLPPPLARAWVRTLLGLGVATIVALAPYLGAASIPGFSALVELVPRTERGTAHALAAAILGVVATVVQWSGSDRISSAELRRSFQRSLMTFSVGLGGLLVASTLVVVPVFVPSTGYTERYIVGFTRPDREPCPIAEVPSEAECISQRLTLSPARVSGHWGDREVRVARLALLLPYLLSIGSFGWMVGLLILKQGYSLRSTGIQRVPSHRGSAHSGLREP